MEEPAETREETKHSGGFGIYALWAGVVLLLYVLSAGPLQLLVAKGIWQRRSIGNFSLESIYDPLIWAYDETPLHKPLGMYMHLWCPGGWDKNGDILGL